MEPTLSEYVKMCAGDYEDGMYSDERYDRNMKFYMALAQAKQAESTDRQAAALERIADDTRTMAIILERAFDPDKDYIHVGDAALERIAAVLEKVTDEYGTIHIIEDKP